ncbi:NAD(P)/FAD-dependent oxidoreductase [Methylocystis bryophila]|uniref:NAD(P)/FAD-dependent oxidoreductase n=1 Tax=Methylocystis bryophila TaxID=655015 RepID=UPI001FD8A7D0|nr:NAD(P)/FAD-dependent oxidoreductase [Methylocystis bryophila]
MIIAGAGVVGLAAARALGGAGLSVLAIESAAGIGTGISSRNSEVIHAGLYYPPASLKAELCRQGAEMLYRYCEARGVECKRLGKLVVAADPSQEAKLDAIARNARGSGVRDLVALDGAEARQLEPDLRCHCAILSPSTGIIDSHGLMLALQGDAEAQGVSFAFNARIEGGALEKGRVVLHIRDRASGESLSLRAKTFVNAAGLGATAIARAIEGFPSDAVPPFHLARGCYFALPGRAPFRRLIYPIPVAGGLGVHLTLDLAGQARFGPDVEWIEQESYEVDPRRADAFYAEIRRYWPDLAEGALLPAYAGIRPKISGPGEPAADFRIDGPQEHGAASVINLFGIESPGLTASLAIGELVRDRVRGML